MDTLDELFLLGRVGDYLAGLRVRLLEALVDVGGLGATDLLNDFYELN